MTIRKNCVGALIKGALWVLVGALGLGGGSEPAAALELTYETTLTGSSGPLRDSFGALAVSRSAHRLFALDFATDQVVIIDTQTLARLGTVPVERAGQSPLLLAVGHHPNGPGNGFDDHLFISDASGLRVSDALTLAPVADIHGSLSTSGGFDDGHHMVVDSRGQRIFVTDHDRRLRMFDFSLRPLMDAPSLRLNEPLGIAAHPSGQLFVTDEENSAGLFRLNADLSLDAALATSFFDGAEGVAIAPDSGLVFAADEDGGEVEIFDAGTLERVGGIIVGNGRSDGPYWLGVDDAAGRLFLLSDSQVAGGFGVHVYSGVIPEPSTGLLFMEALLAIGGVAWKGRRRTVREQD